MRKGQTAMEYLMTYGWAILIILIVGGLLVYYGVFSIRPGASKQGFGLVDLSSPWDYNTAGALRFRIENRVGQAINVTRAWITNPATSAIGTGDGADFADVLLSPGQTSAFITATPTSPIIGSTGDAYSIKVTIEYYVGTEPFNSTGQLGGTRS